MIVHEALWVVLIIEIDIVIYFYRLDRNDAKKMLVSSLEVVFLVLKMMIIFKADVDKNSILKTLI